MSLPRWVHRRSLTWGHSQINSLALGFSASGSGGCSLGTHTPRGLPGRGPLGPCPSALHSEVPPAAVSQVLLRPLNPPPGWCPSSQMLFSGHTEAGWRGACCQIRSCLRLLFGPTASSRLFLLRAAGCLGVRIPGRGTRTSTCWGGVPEARRPASVSLCLRRGCWCVLHNTAQGHDEETFRTAGRA